MYQAREFRGAFGGGESAPNIESGADAKSIQVPMSSLLSPALAEP